MVVLFVFLLIFSPPLHAMGGQAIDSCEARFSFPLSAKQMPEELEYSGETIKRSNIRWTLLQLAHNQHNEYFLSIKLHDNTFRKIPCEFSYSPKPLHPPTIKNLLTDYTADVLCQGTYIKVPPLSLGESDASIAGQEDDKIPFIFLTETGVRGFKISGACLSEDKKSDELGALLNSRYDDEEEQVSQWALYMALVNERSSGDRGKNDDIWIHLQSRRQFTNPKNLDYIGFPLTQDSTALASTRAQKSPQTGQSPAHRKLNFSQEPCGMGKKKTTRSTRSIFLPPCDKALQTIREEENIDTGVTEGPPIYHQADSPSSYCQGMDSLATAPQQQKSITQGTLDPHPEKKRRKSI